jgi:PST family polysaccharide transporter
MNQPDPTGAGASQVGSAIRSAMAWNLVTMAFAQVALASIFLLLASRLDPTIFGIFALAGVIIDFLYFLGSSSIVDAIVQRQDYSRRTLSTITWATLAITAAATVVLLAGSSVYASLVNAPQVAGVLEVLSLTMLLLPFVVVPTAILRQKMDFKGIAVLGMSSSFAGSLAALATAYSPYIEWSLVVQRFVTSITMIALATLRTRAIPFLAFDATAARVWFAAASRIFAGQSLAGIMPRIVDLLFGVFFGVAAVGHLRVASRLSDIAMNTLVNPVSQLWVILLSPAKDSVDGGRSIFLQLSGLVAFIGLPGFLGLALVSNEVVTLTLPPEYAPVAAMLTVLCASQIFLPLTNPRNAILTALQKFDHLMWFSALDFTLNIVGLLVLISLGPALALLGGLFSAIPLTILAMPIILRSLKVGMGEYARKLAPAYAAVAAMCAGVLMIAPYLKDMNPIESLLIKAAAGAIIYLAVMGVFFRDAVQVSVRAFSAR